MWFFLARSLSKSKCCIPHNPFPPYLCICQGVLTSPCTRRYRNETLGGDVVSEITKPRRCIRWWCNQWDHKNLGDASGGDATSELTFEKKPRRWQWARSLLIHRHLLHFLRCSKWRWASLVRHHFFVFFFLMCSRWQQTSLARHHLFVFFLRCSKWHRVGKFVIIS